MKTARRKYQFPSRALAELALREVSTQRDLNSFALNAAVNGMVEWLPDSYGDGATFYRFAFIRRRWTTLYLVSFHCTTTGQAPHTACYPEEWLNEEIARQRYASNDEQRAYRQGLHLLRLAAENMLKSA